MPVKTEDGVEYHASAYAYVGDPEAPDTWKLRIEETPGKVTVAQLGRAAAALSPGGFRGQPVDLPAEAVAGVKARIRAEYKKLGVAPEDVPKAVQAGEGPRFVIALSGAVKRIPVAILGRFVKGVQKFAITHQVLRNLVENFRKRGTKETVIDYEHASEFPEVAQGQPIPAAGWLKSLDDVPDAQGILWGEAEFTERAETMIKAREYKYLSPAIDWGARDKATGEPQGATLTSLALVNRPFLEAMPAIVMSEGWVVEPTTEKEKEESMVEKLILTDRASGKVRAVHKDGTETVLSVEGLGPEPKVVRLSELKRTADGRFDFDAIPGDALVAGEVLLARRAQELLDGAVKEGKILPAQRATFEKVALGDVAAFSEFVKTLKPQIDLTERGIAGGGGEGGDQERQDARLRDLVDAHLAKNPKQSRGAALKVVLSEHPEMARHMQELTKK